MSTHLPSVRLIWVYLSVFRFLNSLNNHWLRRIEKIAKELLIRNNYYFIFIIYNVNISLWLKIKGIINKGHLSPRPASKNFFISCLGLEILISNNITLDNSLKIMVLGQFESMTSYTLDVLDTLH